MAKEHPPKRYLYWLSEADFERHRPTLAEQGFVFKATPVTPCQVLKSRDKTLYFAPPKIWSGSCKRQGSWYRESQRNGQYMLMSPDPLPDFMAAYLDATMSVTEFKPERLPTDAELQTVVDSTAYQQQKPREWEGKTWLDAVMFKVMFTGARFWGWGDNLKKHWLGHRANHANFLAKEFTTELDGEQVPYSVTNNARVCSSCAEFFNVVEPESRKLVRSCPGSVIFSGALREVYYDVKPEPPSTRSR